MINVLSIVALLRFKVDICAMRHTLDVQLLYIRTHANTSEMQSNCAKCTIYTGPALQLF